jgi:adenylate kinase
MPVGAAMVCPNCPGNPPLYQRPDDNEATVMERLKVYEAQTRPLLQYYTKQGLLQSIDAQGEVDAITALLVHVLTAPAVARAASPRRQARGAAAAPKKKAAAKKAAARKPASRKSAAKKKPAGKKPAAKQRAAAKKSSARKAAGARRVKPKRKVAKPSRRKASRRPARKK